MTDTRRRTAPVTRPVQVLASALGFTLASLTPAPARPADNPVRSVEVTSSQVLFVLAPDVARAELRVLAPDGRLWTSEVAGVDPLFTGGDGLVPRLADGEYGWELRALPGERIARGRGTSDSAPALDRVASGSLTVRGGGFLVPASTLEPDRRNRAPGVVLDFVIADDLIVQGSTCTGFDCVNGEDFQFDTIRMKENNTRIAFVDTSVGAFPTRDWRLRANSSASGGQAGFFVDDMGNASTGAEAPVFTPFTIEAASPNNSIYVDSSGRVGFRTATPVLELHVADGDTPAIRLEQTGAGGFPPQSWDVAGNEANFFVRDVTGGSRLPLRIRPGAPTSSVDIAASGDVGIGIASPAADLHVARAGTANLALANTTLGSERTWFLSTFSTANNAFTISTADTGGAPFKLFSGAPENSVVIGQQGGTLPRVGIHRVSSIAHPLQVGTDATNGNGAHVTAAGVWTNGSSRRHKTGIVPLDEAEALAALAALSPVRYRGVDSPDGEEYVGFIAEEVPELVATADRLGVSPMDVVAVLTRVIQAQRAENDALAVRLARVEAALERLAGLAP